MAVYRLTRLETWALASLFYLPIDANSPLGEWLDKEESPDLEALYRQATNTLQAKGYLNPQQPDNVIPPNLLEALTIMAGSNTFLTATMQRNGQMTWTRFAQAGDDLVQHDSESDRLLFHAKIQASDAAPALVPEWFQVENNEELTAALPLAAFILWQTAVQQQTIQEALLGFGEPAAIDRGALIDAFMETDDWLAVYAAVGVPGIEDKTAMPIIDYLRLLIEREYLANVEPAGLMIGQAAQPLYRAFDDPDKCIASISLQTEFGAFPATGSLIYGDGRLFLAEFDETGTVHIRQLPSRETAVAWAGSLLAKGSQFPLRLSLPDIQ